MISDLSQYQEFIEAKMALAKPCGLRIDRGEIAQVLKPHQADMVEWAVHGGRRALFAAFGLGKTLMQLEICRLIIKHAGGRALIICPLGVKQEFTHDAKELLGFRVQYVRTDPEVAECSEPIMITNYERVRDGAISADGWTVVCLDEASILRGYGTKTYQEFLTLFPGVPYRYVATATPSPNRYKELIHYAGFLGVMDTGQALTRFFQRDSTKANNLTLYPHKEEEFWRWLASWACFVTKPSDLGHDDTGYDLPGLNVYWHGVTVDHALAGADRDGQGKLFRDAAAGVTDASREKRLTMPSRIAKAAELVAAGGPDRHWILWHHLEDERRAIKQAMPEAVEVYGSLDLDTRENRIMDFSYGQSRILATKPEISGSGCNFQRYCADAVFVGIDYKFNDFIQAVHRIYRFLQTREVNIHIIYADSESAIRAAIEEKWEKHKQLVANMTDLIRSHGLGREALANDLKRTIGVERRRRDGSKYRAVLNDCVCECRDMPSESVGLIVTSIPFGNHYEYTASYNDFGHNPGNDAFWQQMNFLTPHLLRILQPGRVAAIHVKDRVLFGNVTGYGMPSLDAFHAETIMHFKHHGFVFFGMITIETDVVRENNQTYRLGWTECCKDGSKMGVGCPEYLLLFRRLPTDTSRAYADAPVIKSKQDYSRGRWQIDARAKWNSSGDRFLTPDEIRALPIDAVQACFAEMMQARIYNYEEHVQCAEIMEEAGRLPATFQTLNIPARDEDVVWHDVNRMRTLNADQQRKRLQNHICPLQFDIVDRCIRRFSNEGDVVFDPFGGIMTVPVRAVRMNRIGWGCELNEEYWRDGCAYLAATERDITAPTLFDLAAIADVVNAE